jgi:hypothetical protein
VTEILNTPTYSNVISDVRDYAILSIPSPIRRHDSRIGVLYDHSRDLRVLNVLSAAWYRDIQTASQIVALGEAEGVLTVWHGGLPNPDQAQIAIQAASDAALRPRDRWPVELHSVPIRDGVLDRGALETGHPLLIIPERFPLGLVRA